MRLSLHEQHLVLREAYLKRDEDFYRALRSGNFKKIKDWNEKGPTVIWEGDVVSEQLSRAYRVQVHYGPTYPYRRPDVLPIKPLIQNQRHQMPTTARSDLLGPLCLLPHNPDGWFVGMTCLELLERTELWLKAYELGTLDDEFAPPEIERFFPGEMSLTQPRILLFDSLLPSSRDREGNFLLIPTRSEKFAFLDSLDDRSSEETGEELMRLLGLILPNESVTTGNWLSGSWFHLDKEPPMPVPRTSADLLTLLRRSGYSSDSVRALARKEPQVVAIRYPTSVGSHWLIFHTKFRLPSKAGFRPATFDLKLRVINSLHPLMLYSSYHINVETIFRRVSGYEVETLQTKSCALLGCGSIGSRIAELLIKSGVGSMWLADKEELRAGNVSRHVLGLDYIGQNKAEGMKKFLHKRNPQAKLGVHTTDILNSPISISKMISESDIVISCLGNDATELYVSQAVAVSRKPVLYCRTYLQGKLGEILISQVDDESPCFSCASLYLNASECVVPRPPQIPYKDLVGLDGDCGSAFIPAAAIDLDITALHGARLVLSLLSGENFDDNYWLIRGREFGDDEYPELRGEIRKPFSQSSYRVPRSVICEFCRDS